MAFLSSATALVSDVVVSAPKGFWVWLINLFRFVGSYGWCVIVFTIALRLLLVPLDFYQKKVAHDNKKKTQAMEPYMEKLRKQYGSDRMAMSAKQRELQKKFKYNTFGPCLPAILSLVIFITLFGGFRKIADYEIYKAYNDTRNAYVASYVADTPEKFGEVEALYFKALDDYELTPTPELTASYGSFQTFLSAITEIQDEGKPEEKVVVKESERTEWAFGRNNDPEKTIKEMFDPQNIEIENKIYKIYDSLLISMAQTDAVAEYENHKDSMRFLWIKNMWRPDALWGMNGCFGFSTITPVPDGDKYKQSMTTDATKAFRNQDNFVTEYNIVMQKVMKVNNETPTKGKTLFNGYYILAILIVGLSILSTKFNAAGNPAAAPQAAAGGEGGQPGMPNMKIMMFMMPVMMGIFAISSNSAFSLYMVASTSMSLLSTVLCTFIIKMLDKKKTAKAEENKFQRYEKK